MIDPCPKMQRIILLISTFCVAVFATGQLSIVHTPKSLLFKGNEALEAESLGDVFAAASASPVQGSSLWNGMTIRSPFSLPRGSFLLILDGADHLPTTSDKATTFALIGDGSQDSVQSAINHIRDSLYTDVSAGSVDIKDNLEKITWTALKPDVHPEEKAFLESIAAIHALADNLPSSALLQFWTVRLVSSQSLVAAGSSVAALAEANKLELYAIENLFTALKKAYNYDVLIACAAVKDDSIVRHKRQAAGNTNGDTFDRSSLNLAETYTADYPVIFNIFLWFGLLMFFSLVSISYTIGNMDPGRDSIIYRMTSTRMKKDN